MNVNSISQCLIAVVAVVLTSCGRKAVDTGWWQVEQERLELSQRLALNEFRLDQREGGASRELIELERLNRELLGSLNSLASRRDALLEEIQSQESGMVAMREDFLRSRREAVIGKTFETFTAWSGRTYHEVSVSSVDDAGVTIRHADGAARLRYEFLSDDQRQLFGLDAESALAAAAKERTDAVEYESWIDRWWVANREKEAERDRLAAIEKASRIVSAPSNDQQIVAANVSPLAKPATAFSSRGSRYSRRYNRYRSSYSNYYYPVPVYRNTCVPSISFLNRLPSCGNSTPYTVPRFPITR